LSWRYLSWRHGGGLIVGEGMTGPALAERPVRLDGLAFRGVFRLLAGDLGPALADLAASRRLAGRGATLVQGLRCYFYLALAQYLAGAWDDAAATAGQGTAAAAAHPRRYDLPLLHLAAAAVPAGRGQAGQAQAHARLAEQAAAGLDYGAERLFAAMARALACQGAGDYPGMAAALGPWLDEHALDGRARMYAVLWRPLLAEGLIGSGRLDQAAATLARLRAAAGPAGYLAPALAWLDGWLAEQRGDPGQALQIYRRGEDTAPAGSPVHLARLLLAHGQLLRRTGHRKDAVQRLRRAQDLYLTLHAEPFTARAEQELARCDLPGHPAGTPPPVPALTSRETQVAQLAARGRSNPEIAAELFISRKAVEFHLGNIYAKHGLQGRHQLRRLLQQPSQPTAAA
jgi:ATP/maltotriose-dependent transcriptional regulator MalT